MLSSDAPRSGPSACRRRSRCDAWLELRYTQRMARLLTRRALGAFGASLGAAASLGRPALADSPGLNAARIVKFRDGPVVPALGQGSARLGQGRYPQTQEEDALRTGLSR